MVLQVVLVQYCRKRRQGRTNLDKLDSLISHATHVAIGLSPFQQFVAATVLGVLYIQLWKTGAEGDRQGGNIRHP